MEFIVLDLENATEDQIKAAIECNYTTARLMRTSIKDLKRAAEAAKKQKRPVTPAADVKREKQSTDFVDEDFENEVEYYYSQLKELTPENIEAEIETALPSRKHHQYERILNRLKLESIRCIKEIKDILVGEGLPPEELTTFQDEYNLELKKIELINNALKPQEETLVEELPKENNLIFVPTTGGNIRVLDEIDAIAPEYYERFYGLFQSIKDGTFKNVKRFTGNSELAGLCEVKDFKVRVIFVRLNRDSYAVISAFIKKSDNDKAYRSTLAKKYFDYQQVEGSLIENLSNPEFMRMQKDYEAELFRKLSPSSVKTPPAVKMKGGAV